MTVLEEPEAYVAAVRQFLREVEAASVSNARRLEAFRVAPMEGRLPR